MELRKLRDRCESRLRDIDIPEPFDVVTFCDRLAVRRGRPLHILPLPEGMGVDGPCGVWMAGEREDWIFAEEATSPLHHEHIIVHEVAHMLCGHTDGGPAISLARLLPDLDAGMVASVLGRAGYSNDEEQEAELLASLILARARRERPHLDSDLSAEVSRVLDRAARTLGAGDAV